MVTIKDTAERRVVGLENVVSTPEVNPPVVDALKEIAKVKRNDKVAIVGYAPSSRDKAPYQDPSWDIWGVNELYMIAPRVDVIFEMHKMSIIKSKDRNPNHYKWLKGAKIPLILLEPYNDFPNAIMYPIDYVKAQFQDYFTNSVSYMIAMAILLGYKEIGIWGVDMATDEEYQRQRPSVEYFIGCAEGKLGKANITIPPECDICKTLYHYGYDDEMNQNSLMKVRARRQELQTRINGYANQEEQARTAKNQMIGALDDVEYWRRCWFDTENKTDVLPPIPEVK